MSNILICLQRYVDIMAPGPSRRQCLGKVPIFIMVLCFAQMGVFIHNDPSRPETNVNSYLRYNWSNRQEVWRFFTYALVHLDWGHLVTSLFLQVIFGMPFEMKNGFWVVLTVYVVSVMSGSLATSSFGDLLPDLVGASGGCYAIFAALLANLYNNRSGLSKTATIAYILGATPIVIVAASLDLANTVSKTTHIAGFLVGLCYGLVPRDLNNIYHILSLLFFIVTTFAVIWSLTLA